MNKYDNSFANIQTAFVTLIEARAAGQGFNKGEFACKVWPELSWHSANSRWAALRKRRKTRKQQGLLLVDALRLAETLGESPIYLIGKAMEQAAAMQKMGEPLKEVS